MLEHKVFKVSRALQVVMVLMVLKALKVFRDYKDLVLLDQLSHIQQLLIKLPLVVLMTIQILLHIVRETLMYSLMVLT